MRHACRYLAGLALVVVLSGCAEAASAPASPPVKEVARTETFRAGPGAAITYDEDLVPEGATAEVRARSGEGSTTVRLAVQGLEPGRVYGAHVHARQCGPGPEDAGPHFQFAVDPVQPSVDSRFANPQNEIWLDLAADDAGTATTESTVAWEFPDDRRAGSVVIHAMPTSTGPTDPGTAGARAACISVNF